MTTHKAQRRVKVWLILIIIGGVAGAACATVVVAFLWFTSVGTGEHLASPDGRYIAYAANMTQGIWLRQVEYVELKVVESATRQITFRVTYVPPPTVTVPDYGIRGHPHYINWAKDSSVVTFPIGGQRSIMVPLP